MQSRQCCRPSACPRLLLPAALQPCEPRNGRCGAERKKTSGQTTVHQVTDLLAGANVEVARLAHDVPVGGELDHLGEGTLATAMKSRTPL
jgi:hypothetical protein